MASFQPLAAARAQGKAHSEAARGQKGHQMGQPFMSVFAAFVNGLAIENPGLTGLAEVEVEWLNEFRKQPIGCGPVSRDVDYPRDSTERGPVRTLVRYRMRTPDPALPEEAQNINKLAHILRKVLLHQKEIEQEGPAPPSNNERKLHSTCAPAVGRPSESAGCLAARKKNHQKTTLHIYSHHKKSSHVLCRVPVPCV